VTCGVQRHIVLDGVLDLQRNGRFESNYSTNNYYNTRQQHRSAFPFFQVTLFLYMLVSSQRHSLAVEDSRRLRPYFSNNNNRQNILRQAALSTIRHTVWWIVSRLVGQRMPVIGRITTSRDVKWWRGRARCLLAWRCRLRIKALLLLLLLVLAMLFDRTYKWSIDARMSAVRAWSPV